MPSEETSAREVTEHKDERKRAEDALLKSEALYRALVESSPDAITQTDLNGRIVACNLQTALLVGHERPEDLIGTSAFDLFVPDELERAAMNMQRTLKDGVVRNVEYRLVRKDGSQFPAELSATVIPDAEGKPAYLMAVTRDISERQKATQEVADALNYVQTIFEASTAGIITYRESGEVISANPAAGRTVGTTVEKLKQQNFRKLESWAQSGLREAANAALVSGDERTVEVYGTSTFGRNVALIVRFVPFTHQGQKELLALFSDITERKRAEERLEHTLERLDLATSAARLAIWDWDIQTNELVWDDRMYELYGIKREDFGGAYEAWLAGVHPDDRDASNEASQQALRGEKEYHTEFRVVRPDGNVRHIRAHAVVARDSNGKPLRMTGTNYDITERKRTEEMLRESEERFSRLAQATFEGIAIHDKGLVLDANRAMTDLFGFEHSELIGMSVLNLAAPESRDRVGNNVMAGYEGPYEAIGLRKDGTTFTGELKGKSIMYCGQLARVAAIRDISERKRAEESLAAEKERLAVTLRSIGDGVITTDVNGCIVIMNKVAEELTGWEWREAQGKPLAVVFNIINEITHQPCENPVARVLLTGGVIELANHTLLLTRDGAKRIIADSGAPIKDRDGNTIGVVLVFRDMTEKQKLLDVIQRTAKLESLGVLAGGIAHDFNNLLAGVFGYLDLARSVSKDAEVLEYLGSATSAIGRARALTLQLLTFAKGGAPIQKLTPLVPFIQETVQFALSGSNVASKFSLPHALWVGNIDKDQIGQVIDNIVINAQHAMPNGGSIEVSAKNVSFGQGEHPLLAKGDYVKVSVKDSGIGMPMSILPRIFDPFYTTKPKGHGLGLATCYSIMNRHGGCIEVESEPGQGSTFHVYLPAATKSTGPTEEVKIKHKGSGRVIVVDDEEMIRITVRRMLESLGYAAVCKSDGKEAIDYYVSETKAGHAFAAIIFDLTIPGGMGGLEAVAEIRKLDKNIPVFVASGYADDSVMRSPAEYGFTSSLSKPFTIAELSEMLSGRSKT